MFSLRKICLPIVILASASPVLAEELWSLEGFQAPESALLDSARNVLYVSNVAGEANGKDGIGFISKVSLPRRSVARPARTRTCSSSSR